MDATVEQQLWQVKATASEMIAFSLRYPAPELVEAVQSGEWADAGREIGGVLGAELPESFGKALLQGPDGAELSGEDLFHALKIEATRLFIGAPEAACSPYEGIWRAADDGVQALLFVNPHSMAVERFMKSCGLGRPEGTNEPLDHIATEFELLQVLAAWAAGAAGPEGGTVDQEALPGGSPKAAYDQFMSEHVSTWAARFAEKLQSTTRLPYYRSAAMLLAALLPVLG